VLIDMVCDCSFRLHTLVCPIPYVSWTFKPVPSQSSLYRQYSCFSSSPSQHYYLKCNMLNWGANGEVLPRKEESRKARAVWKREGPEGDEGAGNEIEEHQSSKKSANGDYRASFLEEECPL